MSTIVCKFCRVQLSYPQGALYIQCPKCNNTMNTEEAQGAVQQPAIRQQPPPQPQPQPQMQTMQPQASNLMTTCVGCGTMLAHPATSVFIQCPKCLVTMNVQNAAQLATAANALNARSRKKRKAKDPNAPRGPSNAYMIFCKERRPAMKKAYPDLSFGAIGAKLGELWRTLSTEEKKPYELRASVDRDRFRKQMEFYQLSATADSDKKSKDEDQDQDQDQDQEKTKSPKSTASSPSKAKKSPKKDVSEEAETKDPNYFAAST